LKLLSAFGASLLLLSACSSPAPAPYVSVPLADLDPGTALIVHGKGMGWTQNNSASGFATNDDGPKLQRFDVTANPNEYVAVFRNFETEVSYGSATFIMPASGTVSGVTDLGYAFEILRNDEDLIYTLSGLYTVALFAAPNIGGQLAGAGFATGSSTGTTAMQQLSGTAQYNGDFIGNSTFDGTVTGTASMNVDFSAPSSQITGTISGLNSGGAYAFADMTIGATFIPGAAYEGTITSTGINPSVLPLAFSFGETGKIAGGFYGPSAEETGATIRITDGNGHILSGAFSGELVP